MTDVCTNLYLYAMAMAINELQESSKQLKLVICAHRLTVEPFNDQELFIPVLNSKHKACVRTQTLNVLHANQILSRKLTKRSALAVGF